MSRILPTGGERRCTKVTGTPGEIHQHAHRLDQLWKGPTIVKTAVDTWYQYAARTNGFIGGTLRTQRLKAFMTQQQRAMLGILDRKYDQLWLRLQVMPLPHKDQWTTDLDRTVAKVISEVGPDATINRGILTELIQAGLE